MSEVLDLSPGALFAEQFRVVKPLARGGMGAVYVVEQVGTARERALKLMHPLLAADERSIERFTREAQVASLIESDHVVEVVAAGVEAKTKTPWLCMELLKGETLAERIERTGRLSLGETREVVKQLGHALSAAHRAGIVHRDLKPENVFLATPRREGIPFTLKVLDFGVAALVQDRGASAKTTQGVGSPMWMAPEQTDAGRVTTATDVWALGLIVFHLLTGKSYWKAPTREGASLTALLVEIMVEPLMPASQRAHEQLTSGVLPQGFDDWFARTVARDVGQRYADASAAVGPLVALLDAAEAGLPPPRSSSFEAFAATAAIPSTRTSPLASTGAPIASAPVAAAVAAPGPAIAAPAPRKSRLVPILSVVLGVVLLLGIAGMYAIWTAMRAASEVVRLATIEGPSSDVHVGPDGVAITTPEGDSVVFSGAGIDVQPRAIEGEEVEAEEVEGEEVEGEGEGEGEGEVEGEVEVEGEGEGEGADVAEETDDEETEADEPAPAPRRAAPRRAPPASAATTEARRSLIDPCWRATFEGADAPASERWTFDFTLDGDYRATNVRITGPTDGDAMSFRRCVVQRIRSFTSPDGSDHVAVTLP